jgi:hypothetical protein
MSMGLSSGCPSCWSTPCRCTPEELARYAAETDRLHWLRKSREHLTKRRIEILLGVYDTGDLHVRAQADVFPDALTAECRLTVETDIAHTMADALRELADGIETLPWKE